MSKRITELPVATEVADDDPVLVTDLSAGVSKQADRGLLGNAGNSLRSVFFSDFEAGDVAWIDTSSSSGTGSAAVVNGADAGADGGFGVWEIVTGGAAGEGIITHAKPPAFAFRGSLVRVYEVRVKLPADPIEIDFDAGFDDLQNTNLCKLHFEEGDATWILTVGSDAGGFGFAQDATAILALAGWQTIRIEVDTGVEARAYIDDVLVATVTDNTAVPQGDDDFTVRVSAGRIGGATRSVFVDWIKATGDRA